MNFRPAYVVLFLFILSLNAFDIYTNFRMNSVPEYEPNGPTWLSIVLWITNVLIIVAAFGAAFKKYLIINLKFWYTVIFLDILAAILASYYEFSAGGYESNEIIVVSLITFVITCIYLLAPLRYCLDIKEMSLGKVVEN